MTGWPSADYVTEAVVVTFVAATATAGTTCPRASARRSSRGAGAIRRLRCGLRKKLWLRIGWISASRDVTSCRNVATHGYAVKWLDIGTSRRRMTCGASVTYEPDRGYPAALVGSGHRGGAWAIADARGRGSLPWAAGARHRRGVAAGAVGGGSLSLRPKLWDAYKGFPEFAGERWSLHDKARSDKLATAEKYGIRLVASRMGAGFSLDPAYIHEGCSRQVPADQQQRLPRRRAGILMGGNPLVLVGFDMRGDEHCFKSYKRPQNLNIIKDYSRFAPIFDDAAKRLPPEIQVLNATPKSGHQGILGISNVRDKHRGRA